MSIEPKYLDLCAIRHPKECLISSVVRIAERLALLILHITIGVESTIYTVIKSENLLLKVYLIFLI